MSLVDKKAIIALDEEQVDELLKTIGIALGNLQNKKARIRGDLGQETITRRSLNSLAGVQQQLLGALVESSNDAAASGSWPK